MSSKNTICLRYERDALDPAAAKRAFDAMMNMGKIDIAAIGIKGAVVDTFAAHAAQATNSHPRSPDLFLD